MCAYAQTSMMRGIMKFAVASYTPSPRPTKRAQMKWEVKGKEKNDFHFDGGERKAAKLRHRF